MSTAANGKRWEAFEAVNRGRLQSGGGRSVADLRGGISVMSKVALSREVGRVFKANGACFEVYT